MRGWWRKPVESRRRLSLDNEGSSKTRFLRSRVVFKDGVSCKFPSFTKILMAIIIIRLSFIFLPSPLHPSDKDSDLISHPRVQKRVRDERYISHLEIQWNKVSKVLNKEEYRELGIGVLNFDEEEIHQWEKLLPYSQHVVLVTDYIPSNVTWETLYPEWIDEEEQYEFPTCPSFPGIQYPGKPRLQLIAVKLPCNKSSNWRRDVARLHLQLAAARLAVAAKYYTPVHLLFITDCWPTPNLFTCKDLIAREGDAWLYNPNLNKLRIKLNLPVGSCELAVPHKTEENWVWGGDIGQEAYATIIHSDPSYVCGAIVAAQSIRMAGSTRDLVILVDESLSDHHRRGLEEAGWKVHQIQRIRNPKAIRKSYNEWNYSKLRVWQLTHYDKIIFIDADLLVLRNIDFLFQMPEITAAGNSGTRFNSGVMVIEPCNCTFQLLMEHINDIESYNGGDQGYLNEIFTWWHRIPKHMNFLKHFWRGDEPERKEMKTRLFGADPPVLYMLHYLGLKPWLCFRDYDCNWNVDILQEFASDVAHRTWWKVHDAMSENLQKYCLLRSRQKAELERDRRQAEKGNYSDGHWKIKIQDPRLKICFQKFCFWESILWQWGGKNWTDNSTSTLPPPPPPSTHTASLSSL